MGLILLLSLGARISPTNTCFLQVKPLASISIVGYNTVFSLILSACFFWETLKLQRGLTQLRVSLRGVSPAGAVVACLLFASFSTMNIGSFIFNEHQHYRTCLTLCVVDKWIGMFVTDYMSGLVADMEKVRTDAEEAMDAIEVMDLENLEHLEREPTSRVQASLARIIGLLRDIRQFIPTAYLTSLKQETDSATDDALLVALTRTDAPGAVSGRAAIVFTDIVSSTQLWEACPEGMAKGMRLHNKSVRDCIAELNGYEVKTIGDAFMVSFDMPHEAVSFGLLVQERMYGITWPQDLVDFCSSINILTKESKLGMQLRIGVNAGPVRVEFNSMTGRADYFGPTVNVAARIESRCVAGSVTAPQEVYDDWKRENSDAGFGIGMGDIELKGVSQKCALVSVIPPALPWREKAVKDALRKDNKPTMKSNSNGTISTSLSGLKNDEKEQVLEGRLATIARVEMRFLETSTHPIKNLNEKLGKVISSLERTEGSVLTVFGSQLIASWNTSRRNVRHVQCSFNFCQLLHKSILWAYSDNPVFVGICTGTVYPATLGAAGQRFLTSIGACLVMAGHLLHQSIGCRMFALYSAVRETPEVYTSLTRPLSVWEVKRVAGTTSTTVHQVSTLLQGMTQIVEDLEWGWTKEYWTAFAAGDEKTIREKCATDSTLLLAMDAKIHQSVTLLL